MHGLLPVVLHFCQMVMGCRIPCYPHQCLGPIALGGSLVLVGKVISTVVEVRSKYKHKYSYTQTIALVTKSHDP